MFTEPTLDEMPRRRTVLDPDMSAEERDFYRWYGAWRPLTPMGVRRLLYGSKLRWWIVGGWAVDAFTGQPRIHEDIDVSFFREDLGRLLEHLSPRYCVWSNLSGTLRPLRKPEDLIEGSRQLWVRRDGDSPWVMDLAMNPHEGETWISVRDDSIRMPIDEATFRAADGISYLQPEIVLLMKSRVASDKNERDLAAILPLLDEGRIARLRSYVERLHPDHRWLKLLG